MTVAGETLIDCNKCGVEYPATPDHFYFRKDGTFRKVCKKCHIAKVSETSGKWRANNHDKVLGYYKKHHATHKREMHEKYLRYKPRHRELMKKWAEEHPEKCREYSRTYYYRHPERVKTQWANWYANNRDYERVRQENKRARRMNATGSFTEDDVRFIYAYQGGRCFYCLDPVGDDFHRDHFIPLARGGTNDWTNIVVSCPSCNFSKRDKLPHEFDRFMATRDGEGGDPALPTHT
jgi:5-methylcytosine-specific restriction endonuclease McrA